MDEIINVLKLNHPSFWEKHSAGLKVIKLAGDASSRLYFRVKGQNESAILCLYEKEITSDHDFLSIQKVLHINRIPVPQILSFSSSKKSILLEDLGDDTFFDTIQRGVGQKELLKFYREILDILHQMASINLAEYPKAPFSQRFFDEKKYLYELDFFHQYFIESKRFKEVLIQEDKKKLQAFYQKLTKMLLPWPTLFCHRDFHSRNIMFKNKQFYIIDFQDARQGPVYYDLASLLDDCYIELPDELKRKCLEYYYDLSAAKLDFESFVQNYYTMAIQRLIKAIGSFAYLDSEKNKAQYLCYIGPALRRCVRYLNELNFSPAVESIFNKLADHH